MEPSSDNTLSAPGHTQGSLSVTGDLISSALEKVLEVEPLLHPVGAIPDRSKPIYPPAGIKRWEFDQVVEACVLDYHLNNDSANDSASADGTASANPISPEIVKSYYPKLTYFVIKKVLESKAFNDTLLLRGLKTPSVGKELSAEQMTALSVMTDVSSGITSLEKRLKRAGISWYKWQAWLHDPTFRAVHDRLASDLFSRVQASVDVQVASGALDGKLDFIKYFNELSGKHDPNRRAHQDVQMILNGIVEIVTRNVKDRETLMQISSELSALVAKLG